MNLNYYPEDTEYLQDFSMDNADFHAIFPTEFYADMTKHGLSQVVHGDDLYPGAYPNPPHQQLLTIPINEGSTPSIPPSPSMSYDPHSAFHESMSPYSNGQYQPFFDEHMPLSPTRGTKDPKYCERRRKNNEASKKSRAKKKEKAKEMESRAHVLEQENRHLRQKYSELEQEVAVYKQLTDKITTCDSQEQVRGNNQFPE